MSNSYLIAGGCVGFTGVALGAMGAHSLEDQLTPASLAIWETAAFYQLVHAPVLIAIGLFFVFTRRARRRKLSGRDVAQDRDGSKAAAAKAVFRQTRALRWAGIAMVLGVLLFSGSLYLLALGGPSQLGPVTPVGGVAFLLGWLSLLYAGVVNTDG
ncbi:MAG: DUF423 domain-containing protein [Pseudomonadales bacterium]